MGRTTESVSLPDSVENLWPDSVEFMLIGLLMDEVKMSSTGAITKHGLEHARRRLNKRTSRVYTYSEVENKLNDLRINYQGLCKLLKPPGVTFDNLAETFAMFKQQIEATTEMLEKKARYFTHFQSIFGNDSGVDPKTAVCLNAKSVDTEHGPINASSSDKVTNCKDQQAHPPPVEVECGVKRSRSPGSRIEVKKEATMTDSTEMRLQGNPGSGGFAVSSDKVTNCKDQRAHPPQVDVECGVKRSRSPGSRIEVKKEANMTDSTEMRVQGNPESGGFAVSSDKVTNCKDQQAHPPQVDVGCRLKISHGPDSRIKVKKEARLTDSTEMRVHGNLASGGFVISSNKVTNCKDLCAHPRQVSVGCGLKRSRSPGSHIEVDKEAKITDSTPTEMRVQGNPEYVGFSITNCVKCLEAIEGLDSDIYVKAIRMFKDADWREMFMAMCAARRLDWLASFK